LRPEHPEFKRRNGAVPYKRKADGIMTDHWLSQTETQNSKTGDESDPATLQILSSRMSRAVMCSMRHLTVGFGDMNQNERLFLLKAELARALGVDPRSKEVKAIEPSAYLVATRNCRVALYAAALAESLKDQMEKK